MIDWDALLRKALDDFRAERDAETETVQEEPPRRVFIVRCETHGRLEMTEDERARQLKERGPWVCPVCRAAVAAYGYE